MHEQTLSPIFLWLFPLGFVGFWAVISYVISLFSGWYQLARQFRTDSRPPRDVRSAGPFFGTVYMMRWTRYSGVVRIANAHDGIYLSVMLLYRIGHPPLFIPWEEIEVTRTERWWRRFVVLTLGKEQQVPMRISEKMAETLGIASSQLDVSVSR